MATRNRRIFNQLGWSPPEPRHAAGCTEEEAAALRTLLSAKWYEKRMCRGAPWAPYSQYGNTIVEHSERHQERNTRAIRTTQAITALRKSQCAFDAMCNAALAAAAKELPEGCGGFVVDTVFFQRMGKGCGGATDFDWHHDMMYPRHDLSSTLNMIYPVLSIT